MELNTSEQTAPRPEKPSENLPLELRIAELIEPFVLKSGITLYDVEFQGRTLRISIEKEGGVSVDDCVEMSRLINPMLDVDDIIPGGRYELEVSSPGLNRSLRKPEHFTAAVGSRIHVTTFDSMSNWNEGGYFEKRRNLTAELKSFDGTNLLLHAEGHDATIPFKAISRSRMEFELQTTPPPGAKGSRQEKKGPKK